MSAPKVPPVPPHLQGEIDGMPKAIPYTRARFGKETELKPGVTYDPNERGGGAAYAKGKKAKGKGSRAEQLEELRDAPAWAQPGKQLKQPEGPSQEDMLWYLMNQDPRNTSKLVSAFGTKRPGQTMANQMTEYGGAEPPPGMTPGSGMVPNEALNATFDDPALAMVMQQIAQPIVDEAVDKTSQVKTAPAPPQSGDGYGSMIYKWITDTINAR